MQGSGLSLASHSCLPVSEKLGRKNWVSLYGGPQGPPSLGARTPHRAPNEPRGGLHRLGGGGGLGRLCPQRPGDATGPSPCTSQAVLGKENRAWRIGVPPFLGEYGKRCTATLFGIPRVSGKPTSRLAKKKTLLPALSPDSAANQMVFGCLGTQTEGPMKQTFLCLDSGRGKGILCR